MPLPLLQIRVLNSQNSRAETIHGTHDTIHITIYDPQYDTYHDIIFLCVFEKFFELNAQIKKTRPSFTVEKIRLTKGFPPLLSYQMIRTISRFLVEGELSTLQSSQAEAFL